MKISAKHVVIVITSKAAEMRRFSTYRFVGHDETQHLIFYQHSKEEVAGGHIR